MTDDPLIKQLRQQISDTDRSLVDAFNARLRLVARLKSYKESRGIEFLDPDREEWMLQYLTRANGGPLSAEGLRELFATQNLTILPGSYLARDTRSGNPGRNRVRISLVAPVTECVTAAERIRQFLETH